MGALENKMEKNKGEEDNNMKAAVISLGSKSSKWIAEAMRKYFKQVDELNLKNIEVNLGAAEHTLLYEGKPLEKYDCVYAKGSFRYTTLLRAITSFLSPISFMPVKASAFSVGQDKLLTQLKLQANNIPTPKTYLAATIDAAKRTLERINYPIVMKFPSGTGGKGVMFADSYPSASSMLDALVALNQPFLLQEYIETGGVDIRAIVIGNKVIAGMKRKAIKGEKRANIHAGGIGESCELDNHSKKIAITAAEAIGAGICGVDFLESAKGPLVTEINLSPGLQEVTKATKIDIADKIAKYLFDHAKERREIGDTTNTDKLFEDLGIKGTETAKQILTHLDFRGDRILLPELINAIAKFKEKHEVIVKVKEGNISIKRGM